MSASAIDAAARAIQTPAEALRPGTRAALRTLKNRLEEVRRGYPDSDVRLSPYLKALMRLKDVR